MTTKYAIILILLTLLSCTSKITNEIKMSENQNAVSYLTPFEEKENYSATYFEAIAFYKLLERNFSENMKMVEVGLSDVGRPIHTIILSENEANTPEKAREQGKQILFINNAIHSGEPCGIDASMLLVRDYLTDEKLLGNLKSVTIVLIPIYNIGGALNRNSTTRANQNGPEAYGFRGNAQNLDLNRDFIKCDSRNAMTFNDIFTQWMPDIFIDNHTSNGADYQYTMTLIPTQHNKLAQPLAEVMNEDMLPFLFENMDKAGWEMTPYVYARNTPDDGIAGFLDLPRYSSGYASLFNCISFMPETHMLKPYFSRVQSTYAFMDLMLKYMVANEAKLREAKAKADKLVREQTTFELNWELDFSNIDTITFKGYTAKYKPSAISGLDRLYYDRDEPYEKLIPHFNHYKVNQTVEKPMAYVVPQSAWRVVERLKNNKIEMTELDSDKEIEVEMYYIEDYQTGRESYEGHYLHSKTTLKTIKQKVVFKTGDYLIYTNQAKNKYIIETLEPQAPDSYFAWNFFDGILQRKEYFSAYVFEDSAMEILENNPSIKAAFEAKKAADERFAKSADAQLMFIYEQSEISEATYKRYPIGRIVK
ncbi:MAG: M14 family metallopeptidase [Saprospiraceae bacterium]|nr:M14 family metallopeptidase [Saprospiraceae bacterium]